MEIKDIATDLSLWGGVSESVEKLKKLKKIIETIPEAFLSMKIEYARELYIAKTLLSEGKNYKTSQFLSYLDKIGITLKEAKDILKIYDPKGNCFITKKQLNLTHKKNKILGRKNYLLKSSNGEESKLVKTFSLDLFKEREAGKQYYRDKLTRQLKLYFSRLTYEEKIEELRKIQNIIEETIE